MKTKVNLADKFGEFQDHWAPKIVGELNGQHVKLAKVAGDFVWHEHEAEDELFLVQKGTLHIEFRDGQVVTLKAGEFHIVPKGVAHRPFTTEGEEVWLVLIEPAAIKHTGNVDHPLTQKEENWLV